MPRERHGELSRAAAAGCGPLLFTVEWRATHDTVREWLGEPMFFSQFGPDETMERVRGAGSPSSGTSGRRTSRETEVEYPVGARSTSVDWPADG